MGKKNEFLAANFLIRSFPPFAVLVRMAETMIIANDAILLEMALQEWQQTRDLTPRF